jgi:hypothetical protein
MTAPRTTDWARNQPAPTQAIRMIQANFPHVRNLGIYVCRNVKGTSTKSAHSEGRALDHIHVEWTRDGSQFERLRFLELQIAILRTGLEDLSRNANRTA